jgi:uncharacterized protein
VKLKFYFLSVLVLLGVSLPAYAFVVPPLSAPVIDELGIISASSRSQIEKSIYSFRENTGVQLQVYVAKSLQGEEIEPVAIQIFDTWKLGDEKTDKGLLFLIAPNEKRMRIEVGQGLEGDIPDVIAKRIISDVVRPYFQSGQYSIGIAQGVSTIQNYIVNADPALLKEGREQKNNRSGGKGNFWIILIVVGIWILIFIFNPSLALYILFSAMRGGGGGGGGGSWGGGGGRSSGGGSSGSW